MTATDELRKLLDERSVEYEKATFVLDFTAQRSNETSWIYDDCRCEFTEFPAGSTQLVVYRLTPEQAIAATLGGGKLTAEQVRQAVEKHWHDLPTDYDMPEATALPEFSYNWHAIADELNATLGNGTCRRVLFEPTKTLVCSECGCGMPKQLDKYCYLHFCPNCGREVIA